MSKRASSRKGATAPPKSDVDEQKDEPVAFVLCHALECSMDPVSYEFPPCLFPVCNTPAVLYTIQWLAINEVRSIYLICPSDLEAHLEAAVAQCTHRLVLTAEIKILATPAVIYSVGDAVRWIHKFNQEHPIFRTTCVVVQGNLVTNVPLKEAIAAHRERVAGKAPHRVEPVLTAVFTRASAGGFAVVVNDAGMVLRVHRSPVLPIGPEVLKPLPIDPEELRVSPTLRVCAGLYDPHISIYTSQGVVNFQDNFEWHDVLGDAVTALCRNFELTGHATFAVIDADHYAAVLDDLPDYFHAAAAVMRRWLHPLTVEMNFFSPVQIDSLLNGLDENPETEVTAYRLERNLVYLHNNVFPDLTARIGHSVVIGPATVIGPGVVLRNATIGVNCRIGAGAVITNSVLWNEVTIGENAVVDYALLATGCKIDPGVRIGFGSMLSFYSHVAVDTPPCIRVSQPVDTDESALPRFRERAHIQWLADYLERKPGFEPDPNGETVEYILPAAESYHELPLLRLWLQLGRPDFPISREAIVDESPEMQKTTSDSVEQSDDERPTLVIDAVFQAEAATLLAPLLGDQVDVEQLRTEYISLKNTRNVESLDCAIGLLHAIERHWGVENMVDGVALLQGVLAAFLVKTSDQIDFLFWWLEECAKKKGGAGMTNADLFIETVQDFLTRGIIADGGMAAWQAEVDETKDDLVPRERDVYDAWLESQSP
jgi:translation initiation factor eIF-2B subunit epsilon